MSNTTGSFSGGYRGRHPDMSYLFVFGGSTSDENEVADASSSTSEDQGNEDALSDVSSQPDDDDFDDDFEDDFGPKQTAQELFGFVKAMLAPNGTSGKTLSDYINTLLKIIPTLLPRLRVALINRNAKLLEGIEEQLSALEPEFSGLEFQLTHLYRVFRLQVPRLSHPVWRDFCETLASLRENLLMFLAIATRNDDSEMELFIRYSPLAAKEFQDKHVRKVQQFQWTVADWFRQADTTVKGGWRALHAP